MELLRNYQVRKQLQLVQGAQDDDYDPDKLSARIEQAYMSVFGNQVAANYQNSRPVSPTHRQKAGSPQTSFRLSQADEDSQRDFKVMMEGLEARIDSLEERNARLALDAEDKSKELHDIQKKLTDMTHDRDQFAAQVSMLKTVVSSESSAGKVLERVSARESTSNLEFKLEIYKQQIVMLNNELEKLRSHR
jgi:chaperonin cofactor prefoldin